MIDFSQRKRTSHERQKESYACGDWSSGQKWNDDAPKEHLDPGSISLINSGACGAFVHGLEDEYLGDYFLTLLLRFHSFIHFCYNKN